MALGAETQGDLTIPLSSDPNWLAILICQGADRANVHYEKLIAHYDVTRGVVDPPAGLDPIAQRLVGELLIYAAESFAVVLGKAFAEASVTPPDVSLAAATVVAALKVPMKFVLNRLADAGDRREVECMYDELRATGRVQQTLPEEARQVRDGYARDVLAKRVPLDVSNVFPFTPRPESVQRIERARIEAARAAGNPAASGAVVALEPRPAPPRPVVDAIADSAPPAEIVPVAAAEVPPTSADTAARVHLTPAHAVVDGPSIGPKMAERLAPHGIKTVADLFAADPETLAAALDQKYVKAATIRDWQDQARLVCAVPGLRGTHAQLLVGAGYRSAAAVAGAETGPLCAAVLRFATSPEGQRVLRDGAAPDAAKIASWLENARRAHAA